MSAVENRADAEWMLRAARGDIRTPDALSYVRTAKSDPDRLAQWPELADALGEGDQHYPGDDRRATTPPWEVEVDVDPATTEEFIRQGRSPLLAGLVSGAWLDEQDFPPLSFHLQGIIPEGATLLVGPPKAGKSWLVLGLALGVASGGTALGVPVEQRPVLYLALEDSHRRLQARCRALTAGQSLPAALDVILALEQPGSLLATVDEWMALHEGERPLVILDTLGKVMPPKQNGASSYVHDYQVTSQLKRLVDGEPGSALVIVHHTRKAAGEDFVDSSSGTHGIAGACDTIIALARSRGEAEAVLHVTGRDVDEAEYAVERVGPAWQLAGGDLIQARTAAAAARASEGVGDEMGQLVAMVASQPEGMRVAELAEALGWDQRKVRTYADRAANADRLVKPQRGLYAIPVSSVSSGPLPGLSRDTPAVSSVSFLHGDGDR